MKSCAAMLHACISVICSGWMLQAETQQGYLQTVIQPGTELRNPSLFVDANRENMKPIAQTKTFWWWG